MSLIYKTDEDDTIPETPRPEPTPDEWDDQYADDPRRLVFHKRL